MEDSLAPDLRKLPSIKKQHGSRRDFGEQGR
jgi:hypothetical protein